MTMKCLVVILIISWLSYSSANFNDTFVKIFNPRPTRNSIYHLSVQFLKSCDLNLKKIIIYNNVSSQDTFAAIAEVQPQTSVTLLSDVIKWQHVARYRFVLDMDLKIDAVVIIIETKLAWHLMTNLFSQWPFNRDCIVYIVPVPLYDCDRYKWILELIMRFYFPAAYFICLVDGQFIRIYTQDPYGDTKPPHWNPNFQDIFWGKNWTMYERSYEKDMNELCPGFYFERTDPINKIFPIIGVRSVYIRTRLKKLNEKLENDIILEKFLSPKFAEKARYLKRLLKLQFRYFILNPPHESVLMKYAYHTRSIDVVIYPRWTTEEKLWNYFHPAILEPYAILSHYNGFMTPLEKIIEFYGPWTLISLTVTLSVTFIIIWIITKRIYVAALNIVRLLINTEILIPIDTQSRKIYFSMIFLYFLVFHATFSGHLSEFLTKIVYRPNIETLEDLKDPKIKKIYSFQYNFYGDELEMLQKKLEYIYFFDQCSRIHNERNAVCIGPFLRLIQNWMELFYAENITYISKNTFGLSVLSEVYRPGFPLSEQMNKALIYLCDIGLANNDTELISISEWRIIEKYMEIFFAENESIKIVHLHFAFVLLIVGYCLSFVCFLCEISFHLRNHFSLRHWWRK